MAKRKFLRSKWRTYSKLGRGRKKLQKYRKAKGRHNKVREKMKSNPLRVEMGYKKEKKRDSLLRVIHNAPELEGIKTGETVLLAKIGQKNKIKIIEKAKEKEIKILNLNVKKFNKRIEHTKKEKQIKNTKKAEKKKIIEKKAIEKSREKKEEKETREKPGDKK